MYMTDKADRCLHIWSDCAHECNPLSPFGHAVCPPLCLWTPGPYFYEIWWDRPW